MVSVIVPVYNVKQYLPACIESVLGQTYSDWELLLVDDGSTDGSAQVCDEYARQDSRICVFHKENGGVCSARNLAIDNMTGEFCIMLDSDDLIHPSLLEKTLEIMRETQADAVIYGYEKVADGFTLEQCRQQKETSQLEILSNNAVISEILIGRRFRMLSCNKLYKKELFVNGGGIRYPVGRKFGDDTSVTYRLMCRCNKVAYTSAKYYYYRERPNSALNSELCEENLQLFDSYSEMLLYFHTQKPEFEKLAAYSFCIRLFDFFAKLKETHLSDDRVFLLLKELRKKCLPFRKLPVTAVNLTNNQRILLMAFFLSEHIFWKIYR